MKALKMKALEEAEADPATKDPKSIIKCLQEARRRRLRTYLKYGIESDFEQANRYAFYIAYLETRRK